MNTPHLSVLGLKGALKTIEKDGPPSLVLR